jgi:two-component system, LuxR family, response regulator FixJ
MTAVMTKQLICVVDDDPSMTRMLARAVSSAGFDVVCFRSAEEFLDSARIDELSCLILDIDLPGRSGLELQQHLHESKRKTPVIVISGQATETKRQRALNAGALAFFNKPFDIAALLDALRSADAARLR